jgi:Uma2 family endonuclease
MVIMATETITLADFMAGDYDVYEYVKGELVSMASPTLEHGEITLNIGALLRAHIRKHQLGSYSTETTFTIGKSGRRPDVAFLAKERVPENKRQASPVPPDLAVEIVSPTDMAYDVEDKVLEYLEAGTQMVWVIHPVTKTVTVYRTPTDIKILTINDTLTGEDVVEGFECAVAEIFD